MENKPKQNKNDNEVYVLPFHQRFNITIDMEGAKQSFVSRVGNGIERAFFWLENYETSEPEDYRGVRDWNTLEYVANRLGRRYYFRDNFSDYHRGALDFNLFLKSLEALYEALGRYDPPRQEVLEDIINSAIIENEVDLGIRWRRGAFWSSGAKLLDGALVNKNLDWLADSNDTNVLAPFEKGLCHLLEAHKHPERLTDTVRDMYEALEAMAKIVTGRDKDLSANRELFVSKLNLSSHYRVMMKNHIEYANEYRHARELGAERKLPIRNEVEAFVYTNGLFIRLAIQQLKN